MDEKQRARVKEILKKPVGDYTPEEGRFMTNMMQAYPAAFADVLEEEVRALRQMADRLKARAGISSE